MARLSKIPFFQGLAMQVLRPDFARSPFTLAAQLVPGALAAKSLVESELRFEGVITLMASVVSAVHHSCDELLWCPTPNERIWLLLDNFFFYTMIVTLAAVLGGGSVYWQAGLRVVAAVATILLLLWRSSTWVHAALLFLPIVYVKCMWQFAGTHKGCRKDALVSAAGLIVPATLCFLTAVNTGTGSEYGQEVIRRTRNMPPTPQFWFFHGLWHAASVGAMYMALVCRTARPMYNFTKGERPRRRAATRWWLTVLLKRWMQTSSSVKPGKQSPIMEPEPENDNVEPKKDQ